MTSLTLAPLLWRHCPLYCDITNTNPSTMTSLPYCDITNTNLLLWRHCSRCCDITNTNSCTMTPLTSPLCFTPVGTASYWHQSSPSTMTSLPPLLWRYYPLYYDATNLPTMFYTSRYSKLLTGRQATSFTTHGRWPLRFAAVLNCYSTYAMFQRALQRAL